MINDEGQPLGVISLEEALDHAEKAGLDLVEVSANANPPVCKIMDYGKYRYKQSKKLQDARKSQTVIHVKEIRLRPKTEAHDLQTKIKHIKKFLEQQDKATREKLIIFCEGFVSATKLTEKEEKTA